jgi:hypothetical protein
MAGLEFLPPPLIDLLTHQDPRLLSKLEMLPIQPDRLRNAQAGVNQELEEEPPLTWELTEELCELRPGQ